MERITKQGRSEVIADLLKKITPLQFMVDPVSESSACQEKEIVFIEMVPLGNK